MARPKNTAPAKVEALKHNDMRVNIPTEELRDFVAPDEAQPKKILYPRDPSLDPQLVWKGKDEQDSQPLAVDTVPIYIQEKIQPQAIIEEVRSQAKLANPDPQPSLFGDFNGIDFEQLVEFYQHEQHWTNRMILGDSLLVMTSLAEKEHLKGRVQMIYMDPPYGITFGSNWQVSTRKRDITDGRATDATRQPEQIRAFRDTWALGIHSYLAYLRDRLVICQQLLSETGSIFVQIGDENIHLVRSVLDEVFGSANHVVTVVVKKKGSQKSSLVDPVNDYLLWYSKNARSDGTAVVKFRALLERREIDADTLDEFNRVEFADGTEWPVAAAPTPDGRLFDYRTQPAQLLRDHPNARPYRAWPITNGGERRNQSVPFVFNGKPYPPPQGRCWSHTAQTNDGSLSGMDRVAIAGRILATDKALDYKRYLDDFPYKTISNWWDRLGGASRPIYVVQTNPEIIQRCMLMTTDPGDLVLDPTCGSGTTAYVAEQWGRRWITSDTSRVALALARTRLMSAHYDWYLLVGDTDIKKGFVYKQVRHVTSTTFAHCDDIHHGMTLTEIEAAVTRQAETEPLYDDPRKDPQRSRVSGPFTVESLSPHRVLSTDEERPASERNGQNDGESADFASVIIDNLKKAGVQNTKKSERLKFDTLAPYAGRWIQAAGDYTERDLSRRVAVTVGPQYGTVDGEIIKEAAKEALRGAGFDLLVVCGFAFDAHASEAAKEFQPGKPDAEQQDLFIAEEQKQFGKLPILLARMNPDLAMGDELLKKTGAGNLFTVFGEPDLKIDRLEEGKLTIEIKGVDVYDPTTGVVRSNSTDDIACWFIDTNYNAESFFVRHAYFTGADDPYDKLKRALRADIDEAAWAQLYSTKSYPFDPPSTGKIAVKVINHYGDEVLKVYEVG